MRRFAELPTCRERIGPSCRCSGYVQARSLVLPLSALLSDLSCHGWHYGTSWRFPVEKHLSLQLQLYNVISVANAYLMAMYTTVGHFYSSIVIVAVNTYTWCTRNFRPRLLKIIHSLEIKRYRHWKIRQDALQFQRMRS
ncbi:uncharacterized protein TrAFT101_001589 [Trichoderma asperellum]|uniref:Uncharacterized protein n=1 Tax=Trichoderma asperellum (strain ATCC 204424 / CBS 433.97 / NBRC 101777) TaxID=1042311 RepID=A0A2T3ZDZ8_TRIA4|nr:hypothetical protein M441DRAFT_66788 [Trichoderma asperellum CBS 433.97]PTB43029.1 hypothetical protein M441DRAFT_66788 [Trichoderma asperellum CBS 433.97]UKZ85743.1 hypothetical protein TrAFT101_001589 [Trichoderma asperellum]